MAMACRTINVRLPALLLGLLFFACGKPTAMLPVSGEVVDVEAATLKEGEPVFMSYAHDGGRVDFFVVKTDGVVRSYFDACMKCYPKKLGFRPDGGWLRCRACNERYPVDRLEGVGSCYPIILEGRAEGGTYRITRESILAGRKYF